MSRIVVTPPSQSEAAIRSLLSRPDISALEVEVYVVADFLGIWFKITRNPNAKFPYGEMASPVLTRQLQAMGVCIGDHVLVARETSSPLELKVRMVSPITKANWSLAGRRFTAPKAEQQLLLTA